MNVPQEDLNQWAEVCLRVNTHLLRANDALERGETSPMQESFENTRAAVAMLWRKLERAGADEPGPILLPTYPETPLHLMASPANRRYARLLRETWEALKEVERERGISDGASEVLEDWLTEVEMEIYGPLGQGEGARD